MVINKNTIISIFNDKMTLLQYLKSVEKLLKESALSTIELIRVDNDYFKVKCVFSDDTFIESNKFLLMDANTLLNYIEGSEHVIIDLNEAGKKLKVHLDNDLVTKLPKLDFALVLPQDAPAGYAVVTINDLGQQENVIIGNSLIVTTENGENKLQVNYDLTYALDLDPYITADPSQTTGETYRNDGLYYLVKKDGNDFTPNEFLSIISKNTNYKCKGNIFKICWFNPNAKVSYEGLDGYVGNPIIELTCFNTIIANNKVDFKKFISIKIVWPENENRLFYTYTEL